MLVRLILFVPMTAIGLCCLFGAGLTFPSAAGAQIMFTDITDASGIAFTDRLTESLCWGDYDNDGDPDLYLTHEVGPNTLHENDGSGNFRDVSAEVGVGHEGWGVGCSFGDLDNDGDLDLYAVHFGSSAIADILLRNDGPVRSGGGYAFTDISEQAGITTQFARSSRGVMFFDYDHDGLLDVYVNAIGDDLVYHNLGGMRFEEVASAIGIRGVSGQGVGVVATDVNNDGWIDVFTGNRSNDPNLLFMNQTDGTFEAAPPSAGISKTGLGMGVHSFDFDNDLDMDLYWTTWPAQTNGLYENLEGDASSFNEISVETRTQDSLGWGISNNTGDIDNDGWEDFFVTNGFDASTAPNALFRNNGNRTFSTLQTVLPGGLDFDGRGVAFADIDNDGDVDLLVTADAGEPSKLWRNDTLTPNGWLTVELTGRESNRSGIGARIEVETDLRTTVKEVSGGAGRGSQNDIPVEFGLGEATVVKSVRILWPSGIVQRLGRVEMNQKIEVVESRAPDCDQAHPSRDRLRAPNGRMARVEIEGVTTDASSPATIEIQSIRQDEPTRGRGRRCVDAHIKKGGVAKLRVERDGRGDGRVYGIDFRAEDEFGGSCFGQVQVCVPHDRGSRGAESECGLGELIYDSTSCDSTRREKVDSRKDKMHFRRVHDGREKKESKKPHSDGLSTTSRRSSR